MLGNVVDEQKYDISLTSHNRVSTCTIYGIIKNNSLTPREEKEEKKCYLPTWSYYPSS